MLNGDKFGEIRKTSTFKHQNLIVRLPSCHNVHFRVQTKFTMKFTRGEGTQKWIQLNTDT
jgi:hypothetical protein